MVSKNCEFLKIMCISDTVHACDIPYLFGIPLLGDTNFTESDIQYRDKLVNAVVNFIKSG
jgi:hypothetical protein